MYCGIDIIEVDRIKEAIQKTNKFKENIFTENEILDIEKTAEKIKYQRYAGRFAAKEAVYKAISKILIENKQNIDFSEIEIVNVDNLKRRPKINFTNDKVSKIFKDYEFDISISHIEKTAVAMCTVNKISQSL